eukprot:CAMPEP_0180797064 /NCGR_PEP_ID=MMETSP1038_2-20121128/57154_1 /TAXON_ID=632150 /ORGANISM="Azadinium spinosum, Strain 3D9" /LENGTH=47 /DNA_ID= /DNA_START= /DNA_END= /DNA_ORIENTATION=
MTGNVPIGPMGGGSVWMDRRSIAVLGFCLSADIVAWARKLTVVQVPV